MHVHFSNSSKNRFNTQRTLNRLQINAYPVINMHFDTHHFFIVRHDDIKTICCYTANISINQQT